MQQELPLEPTPPAASQPAPQPAPRPAPKPRRPRAPKKPKGPVRTDMRLVIWVATTIFVVDQVLKYWVVHILQLDRLREIDVLPPWLNLRMAWNQGVNFGLMASDTDVTKWILIAVALAIVAWVWVWIWRSDAGAFARVAAGLLIGGALGNVIDRLLYGAVADFLNMSLPGWQNPYSFNLADIAIFAGAIGLVLVPQKKQPEKPARKPRAKAADNPRDGAGKSG
ncbi:signal peptidase II [Paracoccus sp. S3-43]|uniref:signal peptidase II n=1 Tax=Paracoccus sp. S3-43 TaxID=3030011 RepID=UPI0023B0111B|nr:signal peptidase II [Paracoccus sp. S3-43]WEF24062.1 signal peptidase II [Paracoccus sp. S3-43]